MFGRCHWRQRLPRRRPSRNEQRICSGFVELFALVLEEVDFRFEAINQVELALASEAAGHDFVTIPKPIPHLTREDVLVMTRLEGVPYDKAMETYPGRWTASVCSTWPSQAHSST
ncbi:MAG: AarF/UbiB family protein [Microthrixaceae bacterium]